MKIDHLRIHNYKSLVDFELINPNPFTVFVGPNASGKSNIFEALEFLSYIVIGSGSVGDAFGGVESYFNRSASIERKIVKTRDDNYLTESSDPLEFTIDKVVISDSPSSLGSVLVWLLYEEEIEELRKNTLKEFSRIFTGKSELIKIKNTSNSKLQIDASNLEAVLKRILKNEIIRDEFLEMCELFIPEFENISVHSDNISGIDTLLIKEKYTDKPFTKNLLSDGTFNILALLTAVYQSDEPQFLCIEEPENGLNPYVIEELIHFFREMCKQKGHIIWLNTHSQTLVRHLESHEIILIDKKEGITKAKQIHDFKRGGLTMDQAWLSNAIGGGLPW